MKAVCFIISFFLLSCSFDNGTPLGRDYNLFKGTLAWKLVKALEYGKIEKANQILNNEPSLANFKEPNYGNSVLFWAVLNDNKQAVICLLKHGAKVNDLNNSMISILNIAVHFTECQSQILTLLLEHQPIDSTSQKLKNDALFIAGGYCLDKVKLLVKHNADPQCKIKDPEDSMVDERITPIASALKQNNYEVIEFYLKELKLSPELASYHTASGYKIRLIEKLKKEYTDSENDPVLQKRLKGLIELVEKAK